MDKSHVVMREIVSGFSVLNNIVVLTMIQNVVKIIECGEPPDDFEERTDFERTVSRESFESGNGTVEMEYTSSFCRKNGCLSKVLRDKKSQLNQLLSLKITSLRISLLRPPKAHTSKCVRC